MAKLAPRRRLAIDLRSDAHWIVSSGEDDRGALSAVEDPVLAQLWSDPENAVYDRL